MDTTQATARRAICLVACMAFLFASCTDDDGGDGSNDSDTGADAVDMVDDGSQDAVEDSTGDDVSDTDDDAGDTADEDASDTQDTDDEETGCTETEYFHDADGDGYGDPDDSETACDAPADHVEDDTDCDDSDADVYSEEQFYVDEDGDGYTVGGAKVLCVGESVPDGYAEQQQGGDCDDADASAWVEMTGYIDEDGDNYTAGSKTLCTDGDLPDGYQASENPGDCYDDDYAVYPGQPAHFADPYCTQFGPSGDCIDQSWDYNCDGTAEKRWEDLDTTCTKQINGTCSGAGWTGVSIPDCGEEAEFKECNAQLQTCQPNTVTKAQMCR